ncbi:hypothetical protein COU58_02500 [Candidatus Pacearchaeota archaeon CG10_big_fil_rev_8_21_14_0_10_32_42]|nr:MAG: hypothetical protein COU58_02500 [Candidatus Pacearchaeota archaeon CG10_big_fil_rev_8_21_14_0_10_32_42]
MANLYGAEYEKYRVSKCDSRKLMYIQELGRISKLRNLARGGRILDIGCGQGEFLELFNSEWEKWGIEINPISKKVCLSKHILINKTLKNNFFDIIIFRGTIQHIPNPFEWIKKSYHLLKKGGMIIFLATPNTESVYYRLFKELPMLDEKYNFLLPSEKILRQTLKNFGYRDIKFYFPYRETPYARRDDLLKFVLKFFGFRKLNFAFPRNILECYALK